MVSNKISRFCFSLCLLNITNLPAFSMFNFFSKECYAFLAAHLNDLNCVLIMVGYDLAPDGKYIASTV